MEDLEKYLIPERWATVKLVLLYSLKKAPSRSQFYDIYFSELNTKSALPLDAYNTTYDLSPGKAVNDNTGNISVVSKINIYTIILPKIIVILDLIVDSVMAFEIIEHIIKQEDSIKEEEEIDHELIINNIMMILMKMQYQVVLLNH